MTIYIITNLESGWDCVCGAYTNLSEAQRHCAEIKDLTIEEWLKQDSTCPYVIHETELNENTSSLQS